MNDCMSEKLTLVLSLKGRPQFTRRWFDYVSNVRLPCRILVADGGKDLEVEQTFGNDHAYPEVDYRYFRYPFDHDFVTYYRKMRSVLEEVKTPFVVLCDNDILPILDGLKCATSFMVHHPEYAACRGQHIDFDLDGVTSDPVRGHAVRIHRVYYDRRHTIWRSFEEDRVSARLGSWSQSSTIMWYNIHKTEYMKRAWDFIVKQEMTSFFMIDVAVCLFALVSGKVRVLDNPYMLRQRNSSGLSREEMKRTDLLDRMLQPKWTQDLHALIHAVAERIKEDSHTTTDDHECMVRAALKNHYAVRLHGVLEKYRQGYGCDTANKPLDIKTPDFVTINDPEVGDADIRQALACVLKNGS